VPAAVIEKLNEEARIRYPLKMLEEQGFDLAVMNMGH